MFAPQFMSEVLKTKLLDDDAQLALIRASADSHSPSCSLRTCGYVMITMLAQAGQNGRSASLTAPNGVSQEIVLGLVPVQTGTTTDKGPQVDAMACS
eukprot:113729-Amphidinium_carterae.1